MSWHSDMPHQTQFRSFRRYCLKSDLAHPATRHLWSVRWITAKILFYDSCRDKTIMLCNPGEGRGKLASSIYSTNTENHAAVVKKVLTVDDVEAVISGGQTMLKHAGVVDAPVEFTEVWQCGRAHPDDEILVLITVVLRVTRVKFVHRFLPVRRMCCSVKGCNVQPQLQTVKMNKMHNLLPECIWQL